ncbi:cadherin-like domain-containing protein, partial [Klebsiella pneumoniae]|nr:cadherin-like domain-containing protein [Klebsiella pneumoniae]
LANDTIPAGTATISVANGPASGDVTLSPGGGSFIYTPHPGFVGQDEFTYTLTTEWGSDTGKVTVTVFAPIQLKGQKFEDLNGDGAKTP